jgi:regulator of protease activity HflC (stomatin/prohibitin superfamily)
VLWIILTILALIGGGIALIVGLGADKSSPSGAETRTWGVGSAVVIAAAWFVLSVFMSLHTVGQRQVGIVYNFSGTITGKVDPGIAWTMPWQHIKTENVGLQREEFDLDASNAAVSQDQQAIYAKLTLNYQVEPAKVVDLFKTVGPAWKLTLLDSRVLQDFKEVTSGFTAAQITTNREKLRQQTKDRLIAELAKYDIRVVDVFVKNLDYTQAYKDAINAKNVQVQKSLQAEAKVAQAQAEGDQILAIARKQAAANLTLARSLTPELIRLKAIEKLNPRATVVICTGNTCPSFLPGTFTGSK